MPSPWSLSDRKSWKMNFIKSMRRFSRSMDRKRSSSGNSFSGARALAKRAIFCAGDTPAGSSSTCCRAGVVANTSCRRRTWAAACRTFPTSETYLYSARAYLDAMIPVFISLPSVSQRTARPRPGLPFPCGGPSRRCRWTVRPPGHELRAERFPFRPRSRSWRQ